MTAVWPARTLSCFALGAALGTLLDSIHAYGDVLSYPDPALGRLAWFVPLEFGLLGLAVGLALPGIERAVAFGERIDLSPFRVAAELLLFAGLYLATALLWDTEAVVLAIALGGLAVTRLVFGTRRGDWVYVVAAATLGPAAEAAISALGAFDYRDADLAGVPIWLPALWGNGGLLIRRLIRPIVMG